MAQDGSPDPIVDSPYASVRDLPSVREMYEQLRAFKRLGPILPKKVRMELRTLEAEMAEVVHVVDGFYDLLGPRNWVYHDDMSLSKMTEVLDGNPEPEEAEHRLIGYYSSPDTLEFLIQRLKYIVPMRPRLGLIKKARIDYAAGRYYAVVLVLISVMDGFVNEVEPDQRRGLHARAAEEMNAWDSVTAHHMGLSHALRAFTRSSKATQTDEIFELHRNGIMHGNMLSYDNVVVATKAWNMLFAVSDWARVVLNPPKPKTPTPTCAELRRQMADISRRRIELEAWSPSESDANIDDLAPGSALATCVEFMEAWKSRRYDTLGRLFLTFGSKGSVGEAAKKARGLYEDFPLSDYELVKVRNGAPAVTTVGARLLVEGKWQEAELRWVHVDESGASATVNEPGEWMISPYGPTTFLKETSSEASS